MFGTSALTGDYKHVYSNDKALDVEREDFDHAKWVETGQEKFLPIKDGCKPVQFTLARLTSKQKRFVLDQQSKAGFNTLAWWMLALALQKIEPLLVDGEPAQLTKVIDGDWQRVSDDWMDRLEAVDGGQLFWELVTRIQTETFGNPK